MIIMQTLDAVARRKHIKENKLGKVIFEHEVDRGESICVQYHPKGIPGRISKTERIGWAVIDG
jgi:hypothetical protein